MQLVRDLLSTLFVVGFLSVLTATALLNFGPSNPELRSAFNRTVESIELYVVDAKSQIAEYWLTN